MTIEQRHACVKSSFPRLTGEGQDRGDKAHFIFPTFPKVSSRNPRLPAA